MLTEQQLTDIRNLAQERYDLCEHFAEESPQTIFDEIDEFINSEKPVKSDFFELMFITYIDGQSFSDGTKIVTENFTDEDMNKVCEIFIEESENFLENGFQDCCCCDFDD